MRMGGRKSCRANENGGGAEAHVRPPTPAQNTATVYILGRYLSQNSTTAAAAWGLMMVLRSTVKAKVNHERRKMSHHRAPVSISLMSKAQHHAQELQ